MNPIVAVVLTTLAVCFVCVLFSSFKRYRMRFKSAFRMFYLVLRNDPYAAIFLDFPREYEIHSNLTSEGLKLVEKTLNAHIEQEQALKETNEILHKKTV